jgi:hypothetical protein
MKRDFGSGKYCPKCWTELTDENVRVCSRKDGRTWRSCKKCQRENNRRYREKQARKIEPIAPKVEALHPAVLLYREELARRQVA